MKRFSSILLIFFSVFRISASNSLNLISESQKIGVSVLWDSLSESGILEKSGHRISFRATDPFVLQDFTKLRACDAPEIKNGVLYVSPKFMDGVKDFFREETDEIFRIGAILIDPGHGGKDPGAIGEHKINGKKVTVQEKDVNLNASRLLYSMLKVAYPDKQILMTRSTDKFVSLADRTAIANSVKLKEHEAIIYISIHANSHKDSSVSGYEVWYLSPDYRRTVIDTKSIDDEDLSLIMNAMMEEEFTVESVLISEFISKGLKEQLGKESANRGVKSEEFFVVRNSNMPAVLVELGFVTNAVEAKNLLDSDYLKKLAQGMYNGLSAFVTHFEQTRGFTDAK